MFGLAVIPLINWIYEASDPIGPECLSHLLDRVCAVLLFRTCVLVIFSTRGQFFRYPADLGGLFGPWVDFPCMYPFLPHQYVSWGVPERGFIWLDGGGGPGHDTVWISGQSFSHFHLVDRPGLACLVDNRGWLVCHTDSVCLTELEKKLHIIPLDWIGLGTLGSFLAIGTGFHL